MTVHPLVAALRAERDRRRWTRTHVAQRIGCSPASLWRWETGRASPPLDTLAAWAATLDRAVTGAPVLLDMP